VRKLKVLIIEDNEDDAILEMNVLEEAGFEIDYKRIDKFDAIKPNMESQDWDCIITDYNLGTFNGLDVLAVYREVGLDIPFIMVSGTVGEEIAVKAMKAGIHDYIMKDNLTRFVPALERELNEFANRRIKKFYEADLYVKEVRFQALIEQAADAFFMHDLDGNILEINRCACESLGYSRSELLTMNVLQIDTDLRIEKAREFWNRAVQGESFTHYSNHIRKDGTTFPVEIRLGACNIHNEHYIVALCRDITDLKQAEQRVLQLNRMYLIRSHINRAIVHFKDKISLFEEICDIVVRDGCFKMAWIGEYNEENKIVTPVTFAGAENEYLKKFNRLDLNGEAKNGPIAISIQEDHSVICQDIAVDDRVLPWREEALKRGYKSVSTIPLKCNSKIVGVLMVYGEEPNIFGKEYEKLLNEIGADISFAMDSIRREEELKKEMTLKKAREEQFRHKQKMEALGLLAGGIAHDSNNILGIIIGNLELIEMDIQDGQIESAMVRVEKTIGTAMRGSEITQKLLSFSRKTEIENEKINPISVLENLNEIFKKLFIERVFVLEMDSTAVFMQCNRADFENAIVNLCINAKDATNKNGKIQIKVSCEHISEQESFKYNLPLKAGNHVKISVKDNGVGISKENLQNVFIPFFTTKPDGKGTGLGLPNVYSFVELSKGGIRIDSELGKGTEISIVFPLMETQGEKNET
jgi:PAS domain S-box-containing protein